MLLNQWSCLALLDSIVSATRAHPCRTDAPSRLNPDNAHGWTATCIDVVSSLLMLRTAGDGTQYSNGLLISNTPGVRWTYNQVDSCSQCLVEADVTCLHHAAHWLFGIASKSPA